MKEDFKTFLVLTAIFAVFSFMIAIFITDEYEASNTFVSANGSVEWVFERRESDGENANGIPTYSTYYDVGFLFEVEGTIHESTTEVSSFKKHDGDSITVYYDPNDIKRSARLTKPNVFRFEIMIIFIFPLFILFLMGCKVRDMIDDIKEKFGKGKQQSEIEGEINSGGNDGEG